MAALTKAGFDGEALVNDAKANIDEYAAAIATDTDQAIAANVFGALLLLSDGEVFWARSPRYWIGTCPIFSHRRIYFCPSVLI